MKRPEQSLQIACVKWFRLQYPNSRICAIPNSAKRGVVEGAMFKAQGVSAGYPDLQILHNGKVYFIEMKSDKGRLSDSQKEWQTWLTENGFEHYVCNSFDSFKEIVDLILRKPSPIN